MPLSTGKTGRGVTFWLSDGASPPSWTKVANVTSISIGGRDAEEIDFTHLESEGGFREFQQGFKDAGTISIEYHFNPEEESHVDMLDAWNSGDVLDWRVDYTGAGLQKYLEGKGFVQNPGDLTINVGDPMTGSATVRASGAPEFVDV